MYISLYNSTCHIEIIIAVIWSAHMFNKALYWRLKKSEQ